METDVIKFYIWKPEEHPELLNIFLACKKEAERLNNLNPNLTRKDQNTWVNKNGYKKHPISKL